MTESSAESFSVIVPVFNEASRIEETASAILNGLPPNCEIVFACNGCTDASVPILRSLLAGRGKLLDLPTAGKATAIAEAEKHVSLFPRFYVDADVVVNGADFLRLVAELSRQDLDLLSPKIKYDLHGASRLVRMAHRVAERLPHASQAYHHVLCISERGRANWDAFPNVLADDTFIEGMIDPDRKAIANGVAVVARVPRNVSSYINVRVRWIRGQHQLRRLSHIVPRSEGQRLELLRSLLSVRSTFPAILYISLRLTATILAVLPYQKSRWYRDDSSR